MSGISAIYRLATARSTVRTNLWRVRRGGKPKLTDQQVLEIRRKHVRYQYRQLYALAEEYGVSRNYIAGILQYRFRSHPFNPLDPSCA